MTSPPTAFDHLAGTYDAVWNSTAIGRGQRLAVWRRIDPLFNPADRILDVGCGTGEDALHLESRDVNVYAIDASPAMVRVAQMRGVHAHQLAIEQLREVRGAFDGALSNFGVLNCLEHLEGAISELARLVRSGGYVAICVIGSCCLWETLYFLLRGKVGNAFRRFTRSTAASSIGVDVRYPSSKRLRNIFERDFKLIHWYGIGLCVPPSYVSFFRDETVGHLSKVDSHIAHWPFLRALADHRLFIFERL